MPATTHPKKEKPWFDQNIGKIIYAHSEKHFSGPMRIDSDDHAGYLCNVAQSPQQDYRFFTLDEWNVIQANETLEYEL